MKTSLFDAMAVGILFTAGFVITCYGQPQLHGHQHDIRAGLVTAKPTAGPSTSILLGAADSSTSIHPESTKIVLGNTCFRQDCVSLDTVHGSKVFTPVKPMPQVDLRNLDISSDPAATSTSRRRSRLQSEVVVPSAILVRAAIPPVYIEDDLNNVINEGGPRQHPAFDSSELQHHPNILLPRQDDSYQSYILGGFSSPTSTSALASSASAISVCPSGNGTTYISPAGIAYQIICDVDYPDNDYPFQLVSSFAGCVQKCDAWNYNNHHVQCLAALFIPSRDEDANDCYLKSSIAHSTVAALPIQGAIRLGYATASSSSSNSAAATSSTPFAAPTSSPLSVAMVSVTPYGGGPGLSVFEGASTLSNASSSTAQSLTSMTSTSTPPLGVVGSSPGVTYGSGNLVLTPEIALSYLQGPTQNTPTKQYLDIKAPPSITLAKNLLTVGVNSDLTTGYGLSAETGVLQINSSTQSYLNPINDEIHLSRDGGKGGMIGGEHLFVFCDTGSYSNTTSTSNGNFLGFVSSSVAIDVGMKGLAGDTLHLQDGIGEWSDNVGRMRGFAPLTTGEVAYNLAMQGLGQRYAVWPESSIIPLDDTTGIIYAPIVYDNVNEETKAAVFTYTGNTLLSITAGGKGGPVAQRSVIKIFNQDEVEWGCAGGIRSWGASGIGGNDGKVYLFGIVSGGILIARVSPASVGDRNSFEYWNGRSWTGEMLTSSSTSFFLEGAFMDIDVFYSPRHLTFIAVYMTSYADSTFYYRYLEAEQAILPPFAPGGDPSSDYVENILKYNWSEQQSVYKASPGLGGKYIYSGGVHLGYYGSDDILNGGSKMLLSWTSPTGLDPSTLTSEYQIPTAEITWA